MSGSGSGGVPLQMVDLLEDQETLLTTPAAEEKMTRLAGQLTDQNSAGRWRQEQLGSNVFLVTGPGGADVTTNIEWIMTRAGGAMGQVEAMGDGVWQ